MKFLTTYLQHGEDIKYRARIHLSYSYLWAELFLKFISCT